MIEKMKVVHIVTTALEKKALLDKLQKMGASLGLEDFLNE